MATSGSDQMKAVCFSCRSPRERDIFSLNEEEKGKKGVRRGRGSRERLARVISRLGVGERERFRD
jgi:hypothetical protein